MAITHNKGFFGVWADIIYLKQAVLFWRRGKLKGKPPSNQAHCQRRRHPLPGIRDVSVARGANLSSLPPCASPLPLPVPLSQPTVNLVPGSHRGPDGGNLIARQGQDSALSMVLRRAGLDVIIKLDRTSFKSMPPPDVWRPPAVGVKVLTSPPWQVNTSAQTHTSDAAAYRSAALCWRDKHQFHWRLRVKYSFRFAVILRELRETRPVEAGCRAFVRIPFFPPPFFFL